MHIRKQRKKKGLYPSAAGTLEHLQKTEKPWRCVVAQLRRQSTLALWWSFWLTHHIPGAGPGTFHCSLVDGLGLEARCRWANPSGHDMLKCQRAIPQVSLGPGRNLIGRMSCQIANCENRKRRFQEEAGGVSQECVLVHALLKKIVISQFKWVPCPVGLSLDDKFIQRLCTDDDCT